MSGVILALVERPAAAARILAAARRLAELTGAARINALAIRVPPVATILPTEQVLTLQDEARIRAAEQARVEALQRSYESWAPVTESRGVACAWADVEGRADEVVGAWGRRADFIVLLRPGDRASEAERLAVEAALFETDRPVLAVPPAWPPVRFGRRVAIAWRDDPRTAKAVLAALRALSQAERVDVLAGMSEGGKPPGLPDILTEHGLKATLHPISIHGPILDPILGTLGLGEALLARAHALGADMLVLGAYVHRPVIGLILGGVTRHVLAHAEMPVLMRH